MYKGGQPVDEHVISQPIYGKYNLDNDKNNYLEIDQFTCFSDSTRSLIGLSLIL